MNTLYIEYSGMRPNLREAVYKTNQLLRTETFYEKITAVEQFHMADIQARDIAWLIKNTKIHMQVDLYYAISPLKNVDIYDDASAPDIINMNLWRLDRPVASLCNSLLHGCVHAVNARYDQYYFGHGDSNPEGKEHTAPYLIGQIGEEMIAGREKADIYLQHDDTRPTGHELRSLLRFCA